MGEQKTLTVRVATATVDRVDALVPWIAGQAELSPTGVASRADVLRRAMLLGIEQLERQAKKGS